MKAVFVWGIRDVALAIILALALGLMFYGWVEYKVKAWRKDMLERLKKKLRQA